MYVYAYKCNSLFLYFCVIGTQQGIDSFIFQNSQFLSHVDSDTVEKYESLEQILRACVSSPYRVRDWYDHLNKSNQKPDTIRGRLHNISILFQHFAECSFREKIPPVILTLKLLIKKCDSEIDNNKKLSLKDLCAAGLVPRKGKADLLAMWKVLCPLLDYILSVAQKQELTHSTYMLVIKILLFGFHSEAANGRYEAIVDMTFKDLKKLSRRNYFTSSKTKSYGTHGDQLVVVCSDSVLLEKIKKYMDIVRPQALRRLQKGSSNVFLR
jgi:hypothetical protein